MMDAKEERWNSCGHKTYNYDIEEDLEKGLYGNDDDLQDGDLW